VAPAVQQDLAGPEDLVRPFRQIAYPNDKVRSHALNAGAVGFLRKPFDDEMLIECLTRAARLEGSLVSPATTRRYLGRATCHPLWISDKHPARRNEHVRLKCAAGATGAGNLVNGGSFAQVGMEDVLPPAPLDTDPPLDP